MPIVVTHGPSAAAIGDVASAAGRAQFFRAQQQLGLQLAGLLQQQQLTRERIGSAELQGALNRRNALQRQMLQGAISARQQDVGFQQRLIERQQDLQNRFMLGRQGFADQVTLGEIAAGRQQDLQRVIGEQQRLTQQDRLQQRAVVDGLRQKNLQDMAKEMDRVRKDFNAGKMDRNEAMQRMIGIRTRMGELPGLNEIEAMVGPPDPPGETTFEDSAGNPVTVSPTQPGEAIYGGVPHTVTVNKDGELVLRPIDQPDLEAKNNEILSYQKAIAAEVNARLKQVLDAYSETVEGQTTPLSIGEIDQIRDQIRGRVEAETPFTDPRNRLRFAVPALPEPVTQEEEPVTVPPPPEAVDRGTPPDVQPVSVGAVDQDQAPPPNIQIPAFLSSITPGDSLARLAQKLPGFEEDMHEVAEILEVIEEDLTRLNEVGEKPRQLVKQVLNTTGAFSQSVGSPSPVPRQGRQTDATQLVHGAVYGPVTLSDATQWSAIWDADQEQFIPLSPWGASQ